MEETDLVKAMDAVRSQLVKRDFEVFWMKTTGEDCRSRVRFTTCYPTTVREGHTFFPLKWDQLSDWIRHTCSEELFADIANSRIVSGALNLENGYGRVTVETCFQHPSSADKMEALFSTDERREWFKTMAGIKDFHRVQPHISVDHPAMIASPGRDNHKPEVLLKQLNEWVAKYNKGDRNALSVE